MKRERKGMKGRGRNERERMERYDEQSPLADLPYSLHNSVTKLFH